MAERGESEEGWGLGVGQSCLIGQSCFTFSVSCLWRVPSVPEGCAFRAVCCLLITHTYTHTHTHTQAHAHRHTHTHTHTKARRHIHTQQHLECETFGATRIQTHPKCCSLVSEVGVNSRSELCAAICKNHFCYSCMLCF